MYAGETRSRKLRARLGARGWGVLVQRGRVGKAKIDQWPRWALDNLVFSDWKAGRPFDEDAFRSDVLACLDLSLPRRPDFVVLPDVVAGGLDSLRLSMSWLEEIDGHRMHGKQERLDLWK